MSAIDTNSFLLLFCLQVIQRLIERVSPDRLEVVDAFRMNVYTPMRLSCVAAGLRAPPGGTDEASAG